MNVNSFKRLEVLKRAIGNFFYIRWNDDAMRIGGIVPYNLFSING